MRQFKYPKSTFCTIVMALAVMGCARPQMTAPPHGDTPSGGFYEGMISIYTGSLNHLEGVRRGSCPMYPSCSQYSRQAVARNGFVKGWIMTMDRLMRCGRDELKTAPRVFVNGGWRHYDPVALNQWSAHAAAPPARRPSP